MTLTAFLRTLRKRWRALTAGAVLGLVAAALISALMSRVYEAEARSFVTIAGSDGATSAYSDSQFAMQRVTSYTLLIDSPSIINGVRADLNLKMTAAQLKSEVSVQNPLNTAILNVDVRDTSAPRAARIANAVARRLADAIENYERPQSGGVSPVRVTLVAPAATPRSPVSPVWSLNLGLGLLVGLAVGVIYAVLRESLDTTIRSAEGLHELTGRSTLTSVRYDPEAASRPLIALDTNSRALESFRTLRSNLKFADVDHPPRHVVITSAVSGEGKSTTSQNLAIVMAQSGRKVCLVEADHRLPTIATNLGIEGAVGLSDVLAGDYDLDQALVSWNRGLITVLPSGTTPSDPAMMLGSQHMEELIKQLGARFDFVVFDVPPVIPVSDGAVLAGVVDATLLVVRQGRTKRHQVELALEALRSVNARVLGTVLTFVRDKRSDAAEYSAEYTRAGATAKELTPVPVDNRTAGRGRTPPSPSSKRERAAAR